MLDLSKSMHNATKKEYTPVFTSFEVPNSFYQSEALMEEYLEDIKSKEYTSKYSTRLIRLNTQEAIRIYTSRCRVLQIQEKDILNWTKSDVEYVCEEMCTLLEERKALAKERKTFFEVWLELYNWGEQKGIKGIYFNKVYVNKHLQEIKEIKKVSELTIESFQEELEKVAPSDLQGVLMLALSVCGLPFNVIRRLRKDKLKNAVVYGGVFLKYETQHKDYYLYLPFLKPILERWWQYRMEVLTAKFGSLKKQRVIFLDNKADVFKTDADVNRYMAILFSKDYGMITYEKGRNLFLDKMLNDFPFMNPLFSSIIFEHKFPKYTTPARKKSAYWIKDLYTRDTVTMLFEYWYGQREHIPYMVRKGEFKKYEMSVRDQERHERKQARILEKQELDRQKFLLKQQEQLENYEKKKVEQAKNLRKRQAQERKDLVVRQEEGRLNLIRKQELKYHQFLEEQRKVRVQLLIEKDKENEGL